MLSNKILGQIYTVRQGTVMDDCPIIRGVVIHLKKISVRILPTCTFTLQEISAGNFISKVYKNASDWPGWDEPLNFPAVTGLLMHTVFI